MRKPVAKKTKDTGVSKTLYAQPSEELARRIERTKQLANQSNAQVVLEAVDFWTLMPPEAHLALRRIEHTAGRKVMERAVRQFARDLIGLQYDQVAERVSADMTQTLDETGDDARTEEELLQIPATPEAN
jgi:hypothetical protein